MKKWIIFTGLSIAQIAGSFLILWLMRIFYSKVLIHTTFYIRDYGFWINGIFGLLVMLAGVIILAIIIMALVTLISINMKWSRKLSKSNGE